MNKLILICLAVLLLVLGCTQEEKQSDAYGNFEVEEVYISTEVSGKLRELTVEEGDQVLANSTLALIDSTDFYLAKLELMNSSRALVIKKEQTLHDLETIRISRDEAKHDRKIYKALYEGKAVSKNLYDSYTTKHQVLVEKYESAKIGLQMIDNEIETIAIKIKQIDRKIEKCYLTTPLSGIVLTKYFQNGELITVGKPLVKIANLNEMYVKAYITEPQLTAITLNQQVKILVDNANGDLDSFTGKISYISDKAEFTPKTIQTRDERTNQVYAIKIAVEYNHAMKIGMPAEIVFGTK